MFRKSHAVIMLCMKYFRIWQEYAAWRDRPGDVATGEKRTLSVSMCLYFYKDTLINPIGWGFEGRVENELFVSR